jgi:hypothetical protein
VFDAPSGRILGTPTEFGAFTFTITAEDIYNRIDTQEFTLTIDEQPGIAPGDVDGDGDVNPVDVIYMVQYVYKQADPPPVINSADVNGDCTVDPVDVVTAVNFVYRDQGPLQPGCVE